MGELVSEIMKEFVSLRPKINFYRKDNDQEKKLAYKSTKKSVIKASRIENKKENYDVEELKSIKWKF